jgi:hypothetical protein
MLCEVREEFTSIRVAGSHRTAVRPRVSDLFGCLCHSIALVTRLKRRRSKRGEAPRGSDHGPSFCTCIRYVVCRARSVDPLPYALFPQQHNNHQLASSDPLDTSSSYCQRQAIMASATTKRRSGRQAATRKRSKYVEPESDDDFLDDGAEYLPKAAAPATAKAPAPKRRKVSRKTNRPQTRSKAAKPKAQTRIVGQSRKPRTTITDNVEAGKFKGPSDGKIPDWTSLPLAILRDIFVFASQPLDSDSASWLLKTARSCRAFSEPALEAYYYAPAFLTTLYPHHLLELLRIRQNRYINYNTKVKRLQFEMTMLSYTAHNRPLFDLSELVAELPQLHHLEITNPIDRIPYRRIKLQQWFYPANLFQTLEEHSHRLKTWRWSRDMISDASLVDDPYQLFPYMASVHEGKAFQSLESLNVCGFDVDDSLPAITGEDDEQITLDMPWTISKLPNVKDLTFISCNIVRDDFLSKLPPNLERLEITNCWKLDSNMLSDYLMEKGSHLKELVLKHNITLNLAFLTTLATSCPRLETLTVDGHYYSERQSTNDADPEYEELLGASHVPTWPTTLRHLSLMHLSKWAQEGGTNLFRSLVDGAPSLPDLRQLEIKAHINIPWRDRAGFRDMWTDRLRRVYLRRNQHPNPYHGSGRQFELWKQVKAKHGGDDVPDVEFDVALNPNRLSHIRISPHKPTGDTDVYDTDATTSPAPKATRRSTRVKHSQPSTEPESVSDNDSDTPSEDEHEEEGTPLFVQALCQVVEVVIDNQRPRENMFSERDFLDTERSGDEDWNEEAEIEFEDNRYAW